jgi:hypothetical protein
MTTQTPRPATRTRRGGKFTPEPVATAKRKPAGETGTKAAPAVKTGTKGPHQPSPPPQRGQAVAIATKAEPSPPVVVTPATPPPPAVAAFFRTPAGSYAYRHLLTTIALREDSTPEQKAQAHQAVAAALAAFAPTNCVEAILALQAISLHFAMIESLSRAANSKMFPHTMELHKDAANLSRGTVNVLDALDRRRGNGGQRKVTVEHVHVHQGGQAIVGSVTSGAAPIPMPRTGN